MVKGKNNHCEDCSKDVVRDDKALSCSICDKWYHIKCQRVCISDYELLQKTDDSVQWYCKSCKGSSQKLFKMVTLMHKRQDQIEGELKSLSSNVAKCNEKMDTQGTVVVSIQKDVEDIRDNMPELITQTVSSIIEDKAEEERRECNLIIFNAPEHISEIQAAEKDLSFVREVFNDSLDLADSMIYIQEAQRLGAKPKNGATNSRLLRLTIKDRNTRGLILRNAYKLKSAKVESHKRIGIGRDLTKKQREQNRALRRELERQRSDFPDKRWVIRREKVIELPSGGIPPPGATQQ